MDDQANMKEEDLIIQAASAAILASGLAVLEYAQTYLNKTPYHNSTLTGASWVSKLLSF